MGGDSGSGPNCLDAAEKGLTVELLGPFFIGAGETKVFHKSGRYLEVIAANSLLDIVMLGDAGEVMDEMRGALSGFYAEGQFRQFQLTNPTTSVQTVTLMITDGRGGSRRQPGVVTVIDQGIERVQARKAFVGRQGAPGVAATHSAIFLDPYNNATTVWVERVSVSCSTATYFHLFDQAASVAYQNSQGLVFPKDKFGGLLTGATGPSIDAGTVATFTGLRLFETLFVSGQTVQIEFKSPIRLNRISGGTYAMGVIADNQNVTFNAVFEGYIE